MDRSRKQFVWFIPLILLLSLATTSIFSYYVARDSYLENLRTSTLPLTSDNIYSEIQRDILPTVIISSLMANNTFVRDWILSGEQDPSSISRYLKSMQDTYEASTAFFISDRTLRYYHSTPVFRKVSPYKSDDQWYFRAKSIPEEFEINVDSDFLTAQDRNVFVNHKIHDYDGNFLGIIGIGLSTESVSKLIESYQERFNRLVYFTNKDGAVVMHGNKFNGLTHLHSRVGIKEHANDILKSDNHSFAYKVGKFTTLVKARFVPELNWYLIVEQKEEVQEELTNSLFINLSFSALLTLGLIIFANKTVGKYQKRLERLASTDRLTGAISRDFFDIKVKEAMQVAHNTQSTLSFLLIDLDHFKSINDNYGHLIGDDVLKQSAACIQRLLPPTATLCRWGGEEFLVCLPQTNLSQTEQLATRLIKQFEAHDFIVAENVIKLTVSCGVSELQRDDTGDELFKRTDKALYQAKARGRNQVVLG